MMILKTLSVPDISYLVSIGQLFVFALYQRPRFKGLPYLLFIMCFIWELSSKVCSILRWSYPHSMVLSLGFQMEVLSLTFIFRFPIMFYLSGSCTPGRLPPGHPLPCHIAPLTHTPHGWRVEIGLVIWCFPPYFPFFAGVGGHILGGQVDV